MAKWAIIGLGFISQRHIDAIKDVGDKLILACDIDEKKSEKVPGVKFYTNYLHMTKDSLFKDVDYIAICTPNYLHFPMAMNMLKMGKKVLCEKPLVISADHLDTIGKLPMKNDLTTVLQLRHNPELQALKESISPDKSYEGSMRLEMNRGQFYFDGWKGKEEESGGLLFNIGVHYFDLLLWLFGDPVQWSVSERTPKTARGSLIFNNASVNWSLSIAAPMDNQYRQLRINDQNIDLTRHFENLHTKTYQDVKDGKGIPLVEAGRAIRLLEKLSKL